MIISWVLLWTLESGVWILKCLQRLGSLGLCCSRLRWVRLVNNTNYMGGLVRMLGCLLLGLDCIWTLVPKWVPSSFSSRPQIGWRRRKEGWFTVTVNLGWTIYSSDLGYELWESKHLPFFSLSSLLPSPISFPNLPPLPLPWALTDSFTPSFALVL